MSVGPYDYDLTDPSSWVNYKRPPLDSRIESAIKGVKKVGSLDRYRLVWGGEEQVYVKADVGDDFESGWYLKYHLCFVKTLKGFEYQTGLQVPDESFKFAPQVKFVNREDEVPAGKIAKPVYQREEIGLPRWVVEVFRCEEIDGPVFREAGYRRLFNVCRVPANEEEERHAEALGFGPYRDPGEDIVRLLREMEGFVESTTEGEREAMRARDEEKDRERKGKEEAAVWEDAPDAWEKIAKDNHLI